MGAQSTVISILPLPPNFKAKFHVFPSHSFPHQQAAVYGFGPTVDLSLFSAKDWAGPASGITSARASHARRQGRLSRLRHVSGPLS